jgi:hypothetical protein
MLSIVAIAGPDLNTAQVNWQAAVASDSGSGLKFLEAGIALATTLNSWALVMVGGSILAILSTSYYRPKRLLFRASYLIFVPAWVFLSLSLRAGTRVQGVYLAAMYSHHPNMDKLRDAQNADLVSQQQFMWLGLGTFGLWIVLYLAWWIFNQESN